MPELPEVETTRRGITPHLLGRTIQEINIYNPNLRWPVSPNLQQIMVNARITEITRRAKYLLIHLENTTGCLLMHLGMSGSLRIVNPSTPLKKHDHIEFKLDNQQSLRFHDPRRFGAALWLSNPIEEHPLLASLGPEPLSDLFDGNLLYQLSRGRQVAVKNFIMNNHIVVGVGNIYANESLFNASISPTKPAGKISLKSYIKLAECIKSVLSQAIEQGGTTLRDFVNESGKPGYFQQTIKVYGRDGEPCVHCQSIIKSTRIGQRNSFYCPKCQR